MPTPHRSFWSGLGASVKKDLTTRSNLMLIGGVGVVTLAGIGGGLEPASTPLDVVTPAADVEPISAQPFDIAIHATHTPVELTPTQPWRAGTLVAVDATITNTTDKPVDALTVGRAFGLDSGATTTVVERAGSFFPGPFNPQVPVEVTVLLVSPSSETDTAAGTPTRVEVRKQTWRESTLDGTSGFFDPTAIAEVELHP